MLFDWRSFLHLARKLETDHSNVGDSEADSNAAFRTAISRAYYAAFNLTKNHILSEFNPSLSGKGVHEELINYVARLNDIDPRYASIAQKLKRLKVHRVDADYKADKSNTSLCGAMRYSIQESEIIVQEIEKITS
jgi:uncharacterized protein (UPF0332 family)